MPVVVQHLSANGVSEITSYSWGDVNAGASATSLKFFIWNRGDRDLSNVVFDIVQVGANDGYNYVKWAADTATLSCPWGFIATAVSSGGTIASGTKYYYKIIGLNSLGATPGSLEVSATTSVANSSIQLSWTLLPNATGYKIFRATSSNGYSAASLLTTIGSGATATYTDAGAATVSGAIPVENTTGGAGSAYGSAPTLGTSSITIGTLEKGRQWVYWMGITVGASVTETGNPRSANRRFREA